MKSGLFDEIYVQPAAGDDGSALGAALYVAAQAGEIRNQRMPVPFLGPAHSGDSVDRALARARIQRSMTAPSGHRSKSAACTAAGIAA